LPLLTDADIPLRPLALDVSLFPGIPLSILVHSGFADEQAK